MGAGQIIDENFTLDEQIRALQITIDELCERIHIPKETRSIALQIGFAKVLAMRATEEKK